MSTVLTDEQAKRNIQHNVKVLLDERRVSQRQLAIAVNETPMMISRICNGRHVPNSATLARIAEVLKTSVDWILADHSRESRLTA